MDNKQKTVFYFAYGSNMDAQQMTDRGIRFISRQWAVLKNYTLVFNKKLANNHVAANIRPSPQDEVEGVLYVFPEEDLYKKLDKCEGYSEHYDRETVRVILRDGKEQEAITYVAQPAYVVESGRPTKEYLQHLLAGKDLLSEDYVKKLSQIKTCDA